MSPKAALDLAQVFIELAAQTLARRWLSAGSRALIAIGVAGVQG
jgi:hypothetical protein